MGEHYFKQIVFVGEQDGPPERSLKESLTRDFQARPTIERAYLARAQIVDTKAITVVLGLRVEAPEDPEVGRAVGALFAREFNPQQHLDIVFLTPTQEARLGKVCRPFFERKSNTRAPAEEA